MFSRRRAVELVGAVLLIAGLAICLTSPGAAQAKQKKQTLKLAVERTSPSTIFYRGHAKAKFKYRIAGHGSRNLRIEVVRRAGAKVIKSWSRKAVQPGEVRKIRWSGTTHEGSFAGKGPYFFRVQSKGGMRADRSKAKGSRTVKLYSNKFPVRARHSYGDGYGAGRGHDGQDIFARCGSPLQAAHSGRVTNVRFQPGGAGHYVVISGEKTSLDYTYMHLRGRGIKVREGQYVNAGDAIGKVGESGDARGCHLHFELWRGAWYGGGHPSRDVGRVTHRWDRWS